ncbi:MAG: PIG-L family deacetylase, partial [Pyrinomonadaceae bacterium]|nr:PIG-L family deacetylase [Pyrinomonadaceae bacterium]
MKRFALLLVFWALFACFTTKSYSQAPRTMNAAEIKLALNKLNKVCSVLYIAAHPDDENNAVLAYLSNETLCRTGYLSLTRGEGGQNLLGAEKGDALGVIRTQELLAARRIDGAEQFFTRAVDFGFSKTSEETLRLWNKQEVLSDVVFT